MEGRMLRVEIGTCLALAATVVPGARIELATPAFSGRRSTSELPRHANNFSSLGMSLEAVNSPPDPILRPGLRQNAAQHRSPTESHPVANAKSAPQFLAPARAETPAARRPAKTIRRLSQS